MQRSRLITFFEPAPSFGRFRMITHLEHFRPCPLVKRSIEHISEKRPLLAILVHHISYIRRFIWRFRFGTFVNPPSFGTRLIISEIPSLL